jgi:uncharacterized protein YbjT (DUF2867 family)
MMILVVGATGLVGGMIARLLLEQGKDVRVLVRSGANYQPLVDAGAEAVEGDVKNPASLAQACRGVETVVTTASSGGRAEPDTPQSVDVEGNRHLVDAAVAASARQLIFVSTIGADENSPVELLRAKAKAEAYLAGSGLPYTIIASDTFLDTMVPLVIGGPARAGKPVTLVGEGKGRHSFIAARDVAAFAVASIGHRAAMNQRVIIGGPEPVSLRDVVATYERVLGRRIPVESVAPGQIVPNLPAPPVLAEIVSGMMAALEMFESPLEVDEAARTFGVRLTPLEEYVRQETAGVPA